jgi:DNA-binding NarL/FixJ family response regulator
VLLWIERHCSSRKEYMPMMPTLALIAVRPGSLQDSLVALMTTMHQVNSVLIAEDAASAMRTAAQHRPTLVVLEMSLGVEETCTVLREVKSRWPTTGCLAVADGAQQKQQAESAGADVVLIKGFTAAKFTATIEPLLSGE